MDPNAYAQYYASLNDEQRAALDQYYQQYYAQYGYDYSQYFGQHANAASGDQTTGGQSAPTSTDQQPMDPNMYYAQYYGSYAQPFPAPTFPTRTQFFFFFKIGMD